MLVEIKKRLLDMDRVHGGMTLKALGKQVGYRDNYLSQLFNRHVVSVKAWRKIADFLDMDEEILIRWARRGKNGK